MFYLECNLIVREIERVEKQEKENRRYQQIVKEREERQRREEEDMSSTKGKLSTYFKKLTPSEKEFTPVRNNYLCESACDNKKGSVSPFNIRRNSKSPKPSAPSVLHANTSQHRPLKQQIPSSQQHKYKYNSNLINKNANYKADQHLEELRNKRKNIQIGLSFIFNIVLF